MELVARRLLLAGLFQDPGSLALLHPMERAGERNGILKQPYTASEVNFKREAGKALQIPIDLKKVA